jgi:hypothetical protein
VHHKDRIVVVLSDSASQRIVVVLSDSASQRQNCSGAE